MLDVTSVAVFIISFALCVLFVRITGLLNGKRYPAGPWGVPILGNLPFLGDYPPATFSKWRRKYGDVFQIKMGVWNTIVLNGYSTIREAAALPADAFSGRPNFVSFAVGQQCHRGMPGLSFAPFEQSYLYCRKQASSALRFVTKDHASKSATYDFIYTEAKCLADNFVQKSKEGPIVVDSDIVLTVGKITFEVVYGRCDTDSKEKHLQNQLDVAFEFVNFIGKGNPMDLVPWLQYLMPVKMKALKSTLTKESRNHYNQFHEHFESFDEATVHDVTDFVIKAQLANGLNREQTENSHLTNAVKDIFGAGFETTKTMLKWVLLYVTAFPTVQRKIHEELDATVGANADIHSSHKRKLPYTMAVIYEILRITSPLPFSVPHAAVRDANFRGFDIDKDTVVFFNLHSINHDADFWGDPDNFRPERMLNKAGQLDSETITRVATFSYGRRRCLGERFVLREMLIILATLLQRCTFTKPEGEDLDLAPNLGFIYYPKSYRVTVAKRSI